jgi:thiosulfate dehydrogenase [quinone] large subunit
MSRSSKLILILLRISVGWYFLYQGIVTILNPEWTILPYIKDPGTFSNFYLYLARPDILPYVSYLVKGLFVLIGAFLIIGLFVRVFGLLGTILQLFFYFPLLHFPYAGSYYIVNQELLVALLVLYLVLIRAGEFFGMGTMFKFSRY